MILLGGSYNFHEFSSHGSYVLIQILKNMQGWKRLEEMSGEGVNGIKKKTLNFSIVLPLSSVNED